MTNGPSEPSLTSASLDQSAHEGSREKTSIKTLESTRVAVTLFQGAGAPILSPGHTHDFLGRQGNVPSARLPKVFDDLLPSGAPALDLSNFHFSALGLELHLGSWEQPELVPDLFRDRHLPFAGDLHEVRVLQVLLLLSQQRS